jgi:hypothetical protein
MRSIIPCQFVSTNVSCGLGTNLRHDRLSILSFNVAERHLGTLMLVKFKLRIVNVGDLLKGDYLGPFSYRSAQARV